MIPSLYATSDQTDITPNEPRYSFAQEIAEKNRQIKQDYLRLTRQQDENKSKNDPLPSQPQPTKKAQQDDQESNE